MNKAFLDVLEGFWFFYFKKSNLDRKKALRCRNASAGLGTEKKRPETNLRVSQFFP